MRNIIPYTGNCNDKKWEDFHFDPIKINTLPSLENTDDYKNHFVFRDGILEAIESTTHKPIIKLLVITPDYVFNSKFYGIAYLQSKEIATVEIEKTSIFNQWYTAVEGDENDTVKVGAKIFRFGKNQYSMEPASIHKEGLIFKDTGLFISKNVPNEFIAERLEKEKADFLAPYINLDAKYDFEEVKHNFEKLVATKNLDVHSPNANEAIYTAFEKASGFPFPEILKEFLTLHNGVENTAFMSAESILKEWQDWQTIYKDWTQEDLFDTYGKNDGKALLMYVTPYWLPFLDLQSGNFIALDFAPNTKGVSGQVIRFGADQECAYQEAESLSAFLKILSEGKEIEEEEWLSNS